MFKKLKDKLAEEVKSSPQRIQQFAQAAQAAVTSASSSISDITNSDLFSIGDNDSQQSRSYKTGTSSSSLQSTFQDVSLIQPAPQTGPDSMEYASSHDNIVENQRQRRLSNSSFTSDISFRLPSYESPSMYHLQSDMEVSASEADERGFSGGPGSLDRVTKEQLYAAYRRTQDRYTKYRTQYADLARHYKLLERENAKARSVLVETQDKALRRISELREQCSLEQSAKAHLEKALRVDIEERNMKIEALNTKIKLLQEGATDDNDNSEQNKKENETEQVAQLINISDNDTNQSNEEPNQSAEITTLTNKIEKMEQLLTKYKESLKTAKEKNSQMTTELQILTKELENKNNENSQLKAATVHLIEAKQKIQELNNTNEELQNKINAYDFAKSKEMSTLEIDLQKAQEEISELQSKIEIFTKREEENAISLAENKLSIHKELESKENEIKSLKDSLSASKKEIQSLNIVISDCKNNISILEEEKSKHNNDINEMNLTKTKMVELESQLQTLTQRYNSLEQVKSKADEEFKCLQLQMKQETAEKLAMIDRNTYLENRNLQLTEENSKKSTQISNLESELHTYKVNKDTTDTDKEEMLRMTGELDKWKTKYDSLESEMQEERVELVKLQSEIEKLLLNHELIQTQNTELHSALSKLKSENDTLKKQIVNNDRIKKTCLILANKVKDLQQTVKLTAEDAKLLQKENNNMIPLMKENLNRLVNHMSQIGEVDTITVSHKELENAYKNIEKQLKALEKEYLVSSNDLKASNNERENLKLMMEEKQSEKNIIDEKLRNIQKECESTSKELNSIKKENADLLVKVKEIENLESKMKEMQSEKNIIDKKLINVQKEYEIISNELNSIKKEKADLLLKVKEIENLKLKMKEIQAEKKTIDEKLLNVQKECESASNELKSTKKEKADLLVKVKEIENLKLKMKEMQSEKIIIDEKLLNVQKAYDSTSNELISIKKEKGDLTAKVEEITNKCINLQTGLDQENSQYATAVTKVTTLEKENEKLQEKVKNIEENNEISNKKLETLQQEHENTIVKMNSLLEENKVLGNIQKQLDEKNAYVDKLEADIKQISQENVSLKKQSETIANNIKILESEIEEVRKSHTEIEIEKDHLCAVIQKLENNDLKKDITCTIETQTDNDSHLDNIIDKVQTQTLDAPLSTIPTSESNNKSKDRTDEYNQLKSEYDLIKEDNKRLQSDIEGLQTYLTKISKENGLLNDKLREMIATSETYPDKRSQDLHSDLKDELQTSQDRIDDLIRENSLLIEENLELKDQLQSQNYPISSENKSSEDGKGLEYAALKEKYNNLIDKKNKLEEKLLDLEQINKSVNVNMQHVQESNEKLRLSNDKLERRLDEALVSLRHLHSLQENTELEYLRNILYEYLTGSGTHSVTLAKVLSAIVKFDDIQTQLVLQKEKERQGFLRQLGII